MGKLNKGKKKPCILANFHISNQLEVYIKIKCDSVILFVREDFDPIVERPPNQTEPYMFDLE